LGQDPAGDHGGVWAHAADQRRRRARPLGPLCTLALAGGGLKMGQVVGESSSKAEVPKSTPIYPKDLMATIFHVLGIDPQLQFQDHSGRPQYLLPEGAKPIAELI